ncbi:flagellar basal-body MS-ring/collar protein FliF [Photobacterium lutimaris]|uniref:Flagellar M-ring protein n=1 Tax=Photobacterium lutimaris TaxID=388278 RepID=A0A2T3IV59_9GAMM|nr:flagellar basal-body MS-ring/collar protein FliF [Photobacterium lutimaris]PSU32285.1 flagellar M-ring protein FliF [Photobacterium lutimaris]TDR73159.1 flagellar M-ring protein FliF [Photobacterium lutimaris]
MSTTVAENPEQAASNTWLSYKNTIQKRLDGKYKNVALITVLALLVSLFIVVLMWTQTSPYKPLYGTQERYDNSEILSVLEQEKIQFQLDSQSGQILVPANRLADARIVLAARGVKAKLPEGLEILDRSTGLGTSQFIENARYRQGLEGELARTILAIRAVNHARVHLAIPNRTLFVGINEEKPSAAVMLELEPGMQLDQPQVEAIVNLVSGSITGMAVDAISVVDQYGNLLSADLAMGQQSQVNVRFHELQQRVERDIVRRAGDMLAPLLGVGNFRVQVAATLNFDQIEETHESIDSDPVLRTEFTKQDNTQGQLAMGIPGALSNQPTGEESTTNNETRNERAELNRHYDVGRKVRHTRHAQGGIEMLSVSVLLNDDVHEQGWQQAQLEQVAQMVKDSVGYVAERGDQFSLHAFNFARAVDAAPVDTPWWHDQQLLLLAKYGVYTLLGLSFIILVLRPLVKALQRPAPVTTALATAPAGAAMMVSNEMPAADSVSEFKPASINATGGSEQDLADALLDSIAQGGMVAEDNTPQSAGEVDFDLSTLPPPGSELEVQVKHLQKLTEVEPERVAEVIKKWVNSNESK